VAIEAHEVATTVPRMKTFFIHDNMRIAIAGIANGKCVACGSCKSMLEPGFMGFHMVRSCVA
jgi:predicted PP-loop superfamily ATPase